MPRPTPPDRKLPVRTENSLSCLLLVEGVDDKHVVIHLWQRLIKSDPPFCILDKGGVEKLLPSIPNEIKVHRRKVLGIVVDADDDICKRWKEVTVRLRSAGIIVPAKLDPAGSVIEGKPDEGVPRVGVWLMPDNAETGELEDFVAQMVPDEDPVWPMSKDYIKRIPCAHRKFSEGKILRAKVHAWLSARKKPRHMGLAIENKDLDIDGAHCKRFVGWLERLFAQ